MGPDDLLVSMLPCSGGEGFSRPAILKHYHRTVPGNRALNWRITAVRVDSNLPVYPGTLAQESDHAILSTGLNGIQRLVLDPSGLAAGPLRVQRVETVLDSNSLAQLGIPRGPVRLFSALAPDGSIIVGLPNGVIQMPRGATPFQGEEVRWLLGTPPEKQAGGASSSSAPGPSAALGVRQGMPLTVGPEGRLYVADPMRRFIFRIDLASGQKSLWLTPSSWLEDNFHPDSQLMVHGNALYIVGNTGDSGEETSRLLRLPLDEDDLQASSREVESVEITMSGVAQAGFTQSGDLVLTDLTDGCLRYIGNAVVRPEGAAQIEAEQRSDEAYHGLLAELEESEALALKALPLGDRQALPPATRDEPSAEAAPSPAASVASSSTPHPRARQPWPEALANSEPEGIWETFTRRLRPAAGSGPSSSAEAKTTALDRAHLADYLRHRFLGRREGGFDWMWRRHAPLDLVSGTWAYPGPKHKHSYEENPAAEKLINELLASDLGKIGAGSKTGALVRERFTLRKPTIRDLTAWILDSCTQDAPPPWARIETASDGKVKILIQDLEALAGLLPSPLREELVRTGGRTGLTVNAAGNLVWEYGLRIVLDLSGLKTVHAAGRQASHHLPSGQ